MLKRDKKIWSAILLSVFLLGADGNTQEADERRQIEEQRKKLSAKIESLKREQDFLLFRKEYFRADSKYLVLNVPAGKGELRYRNRLLKGFSFALSSKAQFRGVPSGPAAVTKKVEGRGKRHVIMFGKSFIMQVKPKDVGPSPGGRISPPRMYVSKRDIQSIFYATEAGSNAYIVK